MHVAPGRSFGREAHYSGSRADESFFSVLARYNAQRIIADPCAERCGMSFADRRRGVGRPRKRARIGLPRVHRFACVPGNLSLPDNRKGNIMKTMFFRGLSLLGLALALVGCLSRLQGSAGYGRSSALPALR